ncbi:MAG: glycosyltransferase family 87 protein [Planctomycetota bacterium]
MQSVSSVHASQASSLQIHPSWMIVGSFYLLLLAFVWGSPNFQNTATNRISPLGSDFLQEWVGGYVWASSESAQLYDSQFTNAVQHDSALVGFSWDTNKYYPMVYPPFYYLLVSPLSKLSYVHAMFLWMLGIATIAAGTLVYWIRTNGWAGQHWWKFLLVMMLFQPLLVSFSTAHKSVLLLAILTGTYGLLQKRCDFRAGLVFGLMAFKPHLCIPFGLVMLLKNKWSFTLGSLSTVGVLIGLSFLAGPDLCHDYFWQCISMTQYENTSGYLLVDSCNLKGAISLSFGAGSIATQIIFWILAAVVLGMLCCALRGSIEPHSQRFGVQFSLLIIATVLLSPHFYLYDLTMMLLPMAILAQQILTGTWRAFPGEAKAIGAVLVLLYLASGVATNIALSTSIQPVMPILFVLAYCLSRISLLMETCRSEPVDNRSIDVLGFT